MRTLRLTRGLVKVRATVNVSEILFSYVGAIVP